MTTTQPLSRDQIIRECLEWERAPARVPPRALAALADEIAIRNYGGLAHQLGPEYASLAQNMRNEAANVGLRAALGYVKSVGHAIMVDSSKQSKVYDGLVKKVESSIAKHYRRVSDMVEDSIEINLERSAVKTILRTEKVPEDIVDKVRETAKQLAKRMHIVYTSEKNRYNKTKKATEAGCAELVRHVLENRGNVNHNTAKLAILAGIHAYYVPGKKK